MRLAIGIGAVFLVVLAGKLATRAPAPSLPAPASASVSASPTPPTGAVTVTVFDDGAPKKGVPVVFHDTNGEVLAGVRTGADGKATGGIPPGGMVTVVHGTSLAALTTFTALSPGDAIVVGETEDDEHGAQPQGHALVHLPGPREDAARYDVSLGVSTTPARPDATLSLPILARFVRSDRRFPVLARASNASGAVVAFSLAFVPIGDAGEVDVRLPPWSDAFRAVPVRLGPLPFVGEPHASLSLVSGEDRFDAPDPTIRERGSELSFRVPPGLGDEALVRIALDDPSGPAGSGAILRRRVHALGRALDLTVATWMLPAVQDLTVDGHDPARPTVRFHTGDPTSSRADVAIATLTWPETREHVWTVLAPPAATVNVRLPRLPDELAIYRPGRGKLATSAALLEASFFEGYRDVCAKGLARAWDIDDDDGRDVTVRMRRVGTEPEL